MLKPGGHLIFTDIMQGDNCNLQQMALVYKRISASSAQQALSVAECVWLKVNRPLERFHIMETGDIDTDTLRMVHSELKIEAIEQLREDVSCCKGAWILHLLPEWCSYRPLRIMDGGLKGQALKR